MLQYYLLNITTIVVSCPNTIQILPDRKQIGGGKEPYNRENRGGAP